MSKAVSWLVGVNFGLVALVLLLVGLLLAQPAQSSKRPKLVVTTAEVHYMGWPSTSVAPNWGGDACAWRAGQATTGEIWRILVKQLGWATSREAEFPQCSIEVVTGVALR